MKACGGMTPLIFNLGPRSRWVVSFTSQTLFPCGKNHRNRLSKRMDGFQSGYRPFVEMKHLLVLQRIKPRFPCCPFHILVTTLTELYRLPIKDVELPTVCIRHKTCVCLSSTYLVRNIFSAYLLTCAFCFYRSFKFLSLLVLLGTLFYIYPYFSKAP